MAPIEEFKVDGLTVRIFRDDVHEDPREWVNVGTMVCLHRRYRLGDEGHGYDSGAYDDMGVLRRAIKRDHGPIACILPLSLYDHSGISMNVGAPTCMWDSGYVGYIFVSCAKAKAKLWPDREPPADWREHVEKALRQEVETYNQPLTGDVYGYSVEGDDKLIDSCWGFFGFDYAKSEATEQAKYIAASRRGEHAKAQYLEDVAGA